MPYLMIVGDALRGWLELGRGSTRGVDRIIEPKSMLSGFDYHCPLMSLPGIFDARLDALPPFPRLNIPQEARENLFDHFYRVDNTLTRRVGGTGLGLAICKGFVEAHDGRIWLEENGTGATFSFSLPVDSSRGSQTG